MDGLFLRFYFQESQQCRDGVAWEWLLKQANRLRIRGGSAFRAIAGFGRHGKMHEETFFELAGELAVKVEFILDDALADRLLEKIRVQNMKVFHTRQTVQAGVI